ATREDVSVLVGPVLQRTGDVIAEDALDGGEGDCDRLVLAHRPSSGVEILTTRLAECGVEVGDGLRVFVREVRAGETGLPGAVKNGCGLGIIGDKQIANAP